MTYIQHEIDNEKGSSQLTLQYGSILDIGMGRYLGYIGMYKVAYDTFYWYQIFALDSAVVEVHEMSSSHGGHLTNAMYHHGNNLIKLTLHDETKKRAHDSHIVRAIANLKLSHGRSSYR